jgi:hypothetical protein
MLLATSFGMLTIRFLQQFVDQGMASQLLEKARCRLSVWNRRSGHHAMGSGPLEDENGVDYVAEYLHVQNTNEGQVLIIQC